MRTVIICDRADRAARIRAVPLERIAVLAKAVAESLPVMKVFAAPEWDCLTEDGQVWVAAIVRETIACAVEQVL